VSVSVSVSVCVRAFVLGLCAYIWHLPFRLGFLELRQLHFAFGLQDQPAREVTLLAHCRTITLRDGRKVHPCSCFELVQLLLSALCTTQLLNSLLFRRRRRLGSLLCGCFSFL